MALQIHYILFYFILSSVFVTARIFGNNKQTVSSNTDKMPVSVEYSTNENSNTLQLYKDKGGCYRDVIESIQHDCSVVLADEETRLAYGIRLMMCDVKTKKLKAPISCTVGIYNLCLEQLQNHNHLVLLHTQHTTATYTACYVELHYKYIADRQQLSDDILNTLLINGQQGLKYSNEALENSQKALEIQRSIRETTERLSINLETIVETHEVIEEYMWDVTAYVKDIEQSVKDQRSEIAYFSSEFQGVFENTFYRLKSILDSTSNVVNVWGKLRNDYQSAKQWVSTLIQHLIFIIVLGAIVIFCLFVLPWKWTVAMFIIIYLLFQLHIYWVKMVACVIVFVFVKMLPKRCARKHLFSVDNEAIQNFQKYTKRLRV